SWFLVKSTTRPPILALSVRRRFFAVFESQGCCAAAGAASSTAAVSATSQRVDPGARLGKPKSLSADRPRGGHLLPIDRPGTATPGRWRGGRRMCHRRVLLEAAGEGFAGGGKVAGC